MNKLIAIGILHAILVGCSSDYTAVNAVSLIETTRGYIEECNGNGVNIISGVDYNFNSVLDDEEIMNVSYACDGTNGLNGQDGTDGQDLVETEPSPNIVIVINPHTCKAWGHNKEFKGNKNNNKCNFTL